jgi:hypothetical protein
MSLHWAVLIAIFHAVKVKTNNKIIIGDVFKKSQLNSLQYYFKMVSPTLTEIFYEQASHIQGPQTIFYWNSRS